MTTDRRICRNLALAAAVSLWLAVVVGRALEMIHWPWLWVLAPYWLGVAVLLVFTVGCGLATLAIRFYLWLVARTERRRREREAREFRRAMETGLRDLTRSRPLRFQDQPPTGRPRR